MTPRLVDYFMLLLLCSFCGIVAGMVTGGAWFALVMVVAISLVFLAHVPIEESASPRRLRLGQAVRLEHSLYDNYGNVYIDACAVGEVVAIHDTGLTILFPSPVLDDAGISDEIEIRLGFEEVIHDER